MKNYADWGGCYPDSADNFLQNLHSSSHNTTAEFNICFIIHGSKLDWFFSEPYILEDPGMVVSKVEKNGGETQFSRTDEKAPILAGRPRGGESGDQERWRS